MLRNPDARTFEVFVRQFESDVEGRPLRESEMIRTRAETTADGTQALHQVLADLGADTVTLTFRWDSDFPGNA